MDIAERKYDMKMDKLYIETERLVIRYYQEGDQEDTYTYLSDPETVRYEPYRPFGKKAAYEEACRRIKDTRFLAVCLKEGRLIGNLYFAPEEYGNWEVGYVFNRDYWGHGYATEAVKGLFDIAFGQWGVRRILAMCDQKNPQSWKLMERVGMRKEAQIKQNIYFWKDDMGHPIWKDTLQYAILQSEYVSYQKMEDTEPAREILGKSEDTMIYSCLQKVMGEFYTEDVSHPHSILAILNDFSFYMGEPDEALVAFKPASCDADFRVMVPEDEAWAQMIEKVYKGHCKRVIRYAIKKEPDIFDRGKLKWYASTLPEGCSLQLIGEREYQQCMELGWAADLVAAFPTWSAYQDMGLGVVVVRDGEILAGAASYSVYEEGIEIEIDTREDQRRQGFATACGAQLILECLDRGLYPSWDAQNLWSVGLAEKLGYHFDQEYVAYEVWDY